MIVDKIVQFLKARKLLILRRFFITYLYENKYGVKCSNIIIRNQSYVVVDKLNISPNQLYLDVDFLKDEYTLCNCPLLESPHYKLMHCLKNNQNLYESEYCKRASKGILDSRTSQRISNEYISFLKDTFIDRMRDADKLSLSPISVYKIEDRYYIADGKHRAALCALLDLSIACNVVSIDCMKDSFYTWNYQKMCHSPKLYKKNISLMQQILKNTYAK